MSGLLAPSPEYFKHASEVGLREYGSGEEYENPFELVHQLVRLRLRVFRHVEAMCLRRLPSKPVVFYLVDMQSSDGEKRTAATPDLQRNGMTNLETQEPESPAPVVSVVVEDVGAEYEPVGEGKENAEVPAARNASNLEVVGLKQDQAGSELSPRSDDGPTNPEKWHWCIYEPVVVVPLRCQIGSHRLGILLSRGIVSRVEGGALSRLHNPSLVAIDTVWDPRSSYITAYANISIREAAPALRPSELFVPPREWPEVRIAPLLSAGYSIRCFGDPAGGWELNRLAGALGALVPTRNAPWEVDHSRGVLVLTTREDVLRRYENPHLAPLEVFYKTSDDEKKPSFFFVLENRRYGELTCEVGVFKTDALSTGFSAYASDLLKARLAKVPLGDGKAVLMKYREGLNARYVILSIGEMAGDAGEPANFLANYSV